MLRLALGRLSYWSWESSLVTIRRKTLSVLWWTCCLPSANLAAERSSSYATHTAIWIATRKNSVIWAMDRENGTTRIWGLFLSNPGRDEVHIWLQIIAEVSNGVTTTPRTKSSPWSALSALSPLENVTCQSLPHGYRHYTLMYEWF